MSNNVVIKKAVNCLMHTPDLVRHGSKPRRELEKEQKKNQRITEKVRSFFKKLFRRPQKPGVLKQIKKYLREYDKAVEYAPNQAFVGNIAPEALVFIERPWFTNTNWISFFEKQNIGKFGEIMDQKTFYALLKLADVLNFFELPEEQTEGLLNRLKTHFLFKEDNTPKFKSTEKETIEKKIETGESLPIFDNDELIGCFSRDNRAQGVGDENLEAHHILENLCAKTSGALALKWLLHKTDTKPEEVEFILSCGEEACGDRYQRGAGGMAKSIGHMCGCSNASGLDIKNFCAAPVSAIIMAGALIKAGLFNNVVVVGGGSLAKLGMKFQSFVQEQIPVLDDCLGSTAFLISKDDGVSPIIRLEQGAIGIHPISAGPIDALVYENVITKPLENLGLKISDNDKIAPELQNPEIMEFAGAGDVAYKNYRKIADEAVENEEIDEEDMDKFAKKIGMPGFAPTQGHIPSAVPYLPHAIEKIKLGKIERVMFVGKASLFLNRIIESYDAVSFILEKNPRAKTQGGATDAER